MIELCYILAVYLVFVVTGIIGAARYKKGRKQFLNNLHRGQTINYYDGHNLHDAKIIRVLRDKKEVQLASGKYVDFAKIIRA